MEFSPIIFLLIIWLCIGVPLSRTSQAKKRNNADKQFFSRPSGPAAIPEQEAPKPAPVPEAPPARETRLEPTVSVTAHDDSVYAGSMNAVTGEGIDPCHDEDLAGLNSVEAVPPVRPAGDIPSLPFGWTGSDIVRGIVVSEILNRKK